MSLNSEKTRLKRFLDEIMCALLVLLKVIIHSLKTPKYLSSQGLLTSDFPTHVPVTATFKEVIYL